MNPKQAFPNLPEKVFNSWIKPAIEEYGWSFTQNKKETTDTAYANLLLGESLDYWAKQTFMEMEYSIESLEFDDPSEQAIEGIRRGTPSWTSRLIDSAGRLERLEEFIRAHDKIPIPIIIRMNPLNFKYRVVDGVHRLAAIRNVGFVQTTHIPALLVA